MRLNNIAQLDFRFQSFCIGNIKIDQGTLVLLLDLAQGQVGCEDCSQI